MIVRWLMAHTKAVMSATREGKTYYRGQPRSLPDGVARLLAEVQRIKAEGDYPAARTLFEALRHPLRSGAAGRSRGAGRSPRLPSYTGFVMPGLEPVRDGRMSSTSQSPTRTTSPLRCWIRATPRARSARRCCGRLPRNRCGSGGWWALGAGRWAIEPWAGYDLEIFIGILSRCIALCSPIAFRRSQPNPLTRVVSAARGGRAADST